MTKWQLIELRSKETRKALKKCPVALKYVSCGFARSVIINGMGQCAGCYDPDTGEMETQCKGCSHNEYFEEVRA